MKNRNKKNGNSRNGHSHQDPYDLITLHYVPVQARGDLPDGVVIQFECMDEEGDVVASATVKAGQRLDSFMGSLPDEERKKLEPGKWFSTASSDDELEELFTAMGKAVVGDRVQHVDYAPCDVCQLGEPCDVWGEPEEIDFVPRTPPLPEVDLEIVDAICDALMDADEDGLAMETIQMAMAKFCKLRPRIAAKAPPTMTVREAAKVLEVELPCDRSTVDSAFKTKVRECHPDSGGTDEAMYRLSEAKRTLYAAAEAAT